LRHGTCLWTTSGIVFKLLILKAFIFHFCPIGTGMTRKNPFKIKDLGLHLTPALYCGIIVFEIDEDYDVTY